MLTTILSHSKKIKVTIPIDGAMLNPAIPAGSTQPPLAQTVAAIKSFVQTRTFTKQTWSTFMWMPKDSLRVAPTQEDIDGAKGMTQKTLDFWLKEMKRHGLDSTNGLPEPSFVNDGLCKVFRSNTELAATIRDSACDGSNDIQKAINKEFPGELAAMPQENLVGWGVLDGYGPGTARMFNTPEYTWADEATAEAAHKWQYQEGGRFWSLIGGRAWMPMKQLGGQVQFWRKSSPNPWFWKQAYYPWLDLGPYCSNIADAISRGPQPTGGRITIKDVGCFENNTGVAAAFDVNTWSAFMTKYNEWFIACAHGRIAIASTGLSRLKDGYSDYNQLANHEVGHNLGTGHNSNGPKAVLHNPSESSSHYGDQAANFGQAAIVYVAKNHIGVSNVPSDYNTPIWTFDSPVIGPSNDGSVYPTISGHVASSNQAAVPVLAVVAYVQRVFPETKTIHSPTGNPLDDLSEYSDATLVGSLVDASGNFSIKLEHFAATGAFIIRDLIALNMAGIQKKFTLTGFTNYWSF